MTTGIVFDIKRFALHDGPGIRTTVFLKGCGLRCWWCHNPESQNIKPDVMLRPERCIQCGACVGECPQGAISEQLITDREVCIRCGTCTALCYAEAREVVGEEMNVAQVVDVILQDEAFYEESGGGVTFSGGEPLLQGEFLLALLKACKEKELHTVVDTCGHAPTDTLLKTCDYVDLYLYDLKVMDSGQHKEVTGAGNEKILEHLRLLVEQGKRVIVRMPVIPEINDNGENLLQMAALVKELPAVERIDLMAYHAIGSAKYERLGLVDPMPVTEQPVEASMLAIQSIIEEKSGVPVTIGG